MINKYQDLFVAECERLASLGGGGVNNIEKGSETMCDGWGVRGNQRGGRSVT